VCDVEENDILLLVAAKYDPIEILDILDMECLDLVQALEERILDNIYKFDEVVDYVKG
jgi:hypothetical protein